MVFEAGHIYHVFNRGNNREKIFFTKQNYLYFQKKMFQYLTPYSEIIAWCLMPNHFHWMIKVNSQTVTQSHRLTEVSLNESIGILLRSYTRAINKQENRTGSLFQGNTKALCLTKSDTVSPSWYKTLGITTIYRNIPEKEYPTVCMNYIHQNPVKAGLVYDAADWEFSSI